jgi:hypothetical protein
MLTLLFVAAFEWAFRELAIGNFDVKQGEFPVLYIL